jgi:hypothetical protein
MEKVQLKGEAGEDELRALEVDMTGKMLLASWRGARLEVIQVLREVFLCPLHISRTLIILFVSGCGECLERFVCFRSNYT